MAVIGIDLGTTYSAAARFIDGNTEIIPLEGNPTLPSVVSVLPSGKIAVGWTAKRNQAKNPQDTIVEVKRKMGKAVSVHLGQKELSPPEISALILKRIKEMAEDQLGEAIDGVVISCPAYFKDPQRAATSQAGELAGLKVLQIVNEPTAAAYAYGLGQANDNQERLAMVYDLGGGTFDVTVIKMIGGNLEVIGTGGDPELGGGNFDDRIVDWMLERIREKNPAYASSIGVNTEREQTLKMRLKSHAEEAKKKLCGPPILDEYNLQIAQLDQFEGQPVTFHEVLTRNEFEARIKDLLENSMKWLDEAMKVPKERFKYTENDITDVLLVGGSTRVPLVRQLLEHRYGKERLKGMEVGIDPDEIVARGASMVAAQANPYSTEVVETKLVDVTGHTLSVAVFEEAKGREILHPLIRKETPIPHSA
ncbi:MAG: Hsp70 family protein, partial [Chloroflexota bacterium]